MGIDYGFFAAVDDADAATAVELLGGPAWLRAARRTASTTPRPRPGFLGRWGRRRAEVPEFVAMAAPDPSEAAVRQQERMPEPFDVFYTRAIDPVVQLGTLAELLTGRSFDDIAAGHLGDEPVASRVDGSRLVVALHAEICGALAMATPQRLADAAVPLSRTEEHAGDPDGQDDELVSMLAADLGELAGLARRAHDRGHRLYCWIDM